MLANTKYQFGSVAKTFHWVCAACIAGSYVSIYYALWVVGDGSPRWLPTLNMHWMLGVTVGVLVLLRVFWRKSQIAPVAAPGSALEHFLARWTHRLLYAVMIIMPFTGYVGTRRGTDFGLFFVPSFKDTALFHWIADTWNLSFQQFEAPFDLVHHFVGKWVAWPVILLHVSAALYHHWYRRDQTLLRMLPGVNLAPTETAVGRARVDAA